jgi:hypothetical protein
MHQSRLNPKEIHGLLNFDHDHGQIFEPKLTDCAWVDFQPKVQKSKVDTFHRGLTSSETDKTRENPVPILTDRR